jgi:hypothetical protein
LSIKYINPNHPILIGVRNSNNHDTVNLEENTKWNIIRMIEILNVYQNVLNSNKEIFEKVSKDFLSKLENDKSKSLSITISLIGVIISFASLVLTIDIIKNIIKNEQISNLIILGILVIVISIGLHKYRKMNNKIRNVSEKILNVSKEYYDGYTIQNFLIGFFTRYVKEPNQLKENQLQKLQILDTFFFLVQGSIVSSIRKRIEFQIKELKKEKILNDKELEEFRDSIRPTKNSDRFFKQIMAYAYKDSTENKLLSEEKIDNNDLIQIFSERKELLQILKERIEKNILDMKNQQ